MTDTPARFRKLRTTAAAAIDDSGGLAHDVPSFDPLGHQIRGNHGE